MKFSTTGGAMEQCFDEQVAILFVLYYNVYKDAHVWFHIILLARGNMTWNVAMHQKNMWGEGLDLVYNNVNNAVFVGNTEIKENSTR